MYNKIILAGNLTRGVEIRYTPSGMAVASTGIASNRKFKSANGEQKEEVLFIDLTFFGRTAEIAVQYLQKGSKVLVDGRLKLDNWIAQDGSKRSKHSITVENLQMLSSKNDTNQPTNENQPKEQPVQQQSVQQTNHNPQQNQPQYNQNIPEVDITEDEIPF